MAVVLSFKQRQGSARSKLSKAPAYLLLTLWAVFTVMLIGWVLFASLSTSSEIFSEHMFKFETGFHFENYIKAWKTQKVSVFFMNSLLYTLVSCTLIVLIASPAAYVLSRFKFKGNMFLQNMFASALGIPIIMIIMPLFGLASMFKLTNTRALIIFLYIAVNVPFTLFYLLAFFKNLSTTYEEAAAIDGCPPIRTFWTIMFPLVQPGIITVSIFNFITVWNEFCKQNIGTFGCRRLIQYDFGYALHGRLGRNVCQRRYHLFTHLCAVFIFIRKNHYRSYRRRYKRLTGAVCAAKPFFDGVL